jgi:hypothetical protein
MVIYPLSPGWKLTIPRRESFIDIDVSDAAGFIVLDNIHAVRR